MQNKNKIYIISILFALTVLFLILFFIWPLFLDIKNNSDNLISVKNDAISLEIQNNEIGNFKKVYEDYKPNLEKMNQLFVNPQNPIDFIKFLENTAQESGINAKISLMPNYQKEDNGTLNFQLFTREDFIKILHFSEKLENGSYLVEIENLTIKNHLSMVPVLPANNNTTSKNYISGKVDATFLIKTFVKQ